MWSSTESRSIIELNCRNQTTPFTPTPFFDVLSLTSGYHEGFSAVSSNGKFRIRGSRDITRCSPPCASTSPERKCPHPHLDLLPIGQSAISRPTICVIPHKIDLSSLTEYYSDCSKDGNPTLLLMDMGITTRNLNHGSPLSVTINSTPPKGFYSPASLPRMNLNGRMTKVTEKEGVLVKVM